LKVGKTFIIFLTVDVNCVAVYKIRGAFFREADCRARDFCVMPRRLQIDMESSIRYQEII